MSRKLITKNMKKIYILLIVFFALNIVYAQQIKHIFPCLAKTKISEFLFKNYQKQLNSNHEKINFLKTSKAIIWNWDTIIAYNTNGLYQKHTSSYNSQGIFLIEKVENWENNTWVNYTRWSNAFDINGNWISETDEIWQNNDWVNTDRYSASIDTNGNYITLLTEIWQNNTWENYWKRTNTYDANGNILTTLHEQWLNNSWVIYSRWINTYDSVGNCLTFLMENWQNNTWVNYQRYTNNYDSNGNKTIQLTEYWQNNAWVYNSRNTYTYDSNNNLIINLQESWNNLWVNNTKYSFTYDINGNLLTELNQNWQGIWENNTKFTFTYDAHGNSITGKNEIWQIFNWILFNNNDLTKIYTLKESQYWIYDIARYEAHYISINTGTTENKNNFHFDIFPNPANDKLTLCFQDVSSFQNTKLSIYNLQGQLLIQQTIIQPHTEIDISLFAKGIYVVKINNNNNNEILVSKFIKE